MKLVRISGKIYKTWCDSISLFLSLNSLILVAVDCKPSSLYTLRSKSTCAFLNINYWFSYYTCKQSYFIDLLTLITMIYIKQFNNRRNYEWRTDDEFTSLSIVMCLATTVLLNFELQTRLYIKTLEFLLQQPNLYTCNL